MSEPPPASSDAAASPARPAAELGSVFTTNLPQILRELRASLLVTTYQAGKLIVIRHDGQTINTYFAGLRKPMGLAADAARLVVGTETGIREFCNVPEVSAQLDPPKRHDAVYVFRNHHVTGDIDIHEMALGARDELWFVNTRFSCLCTLEREHSFVPRWRPNFVTGLSPEDRCHLNGLAMSDGKPRWLTALGATDTVQGWRANKKDGGVLIDFATGDVVARGLSMPHSPRWHRERLWVLESGRGSLAVVDPATGAVETVARVPGFTRGLSFLGPLAFIGLSQLRETNAFTEIPITDENAERMSGVWVVNIETGRTIAFLKFSGAVQEIFAVHALAGSVYPEIVDEGSDLLKSTYVLPDEALQDVRFVPKAPGAGTAA
jgi:uncharacterized protein (TIGR03032 family)